MALENSTVTVPNWRRNPVTLTPPASVEEFVARSNQYFSECVDCDIRPTLIGYALAVGLPGPTSLIRLGQRAPELRYAISQCMMRVAVEYEEMIGTSNPSGPIFMLKNIPDFDPEEPVGAPPVQFFNDRKEILLQSAVAGAARSDSEHDKEDPVETYLRLIKKQGYLPEAEGFKPNPLRSTDRNIYPTGRPALTILTQGIEDD